MSRGVAVPRREAERVRRLLREAGWIDGGLEVARTPDVVLFPLLDGARPDPTLGTIVDHPFQRVRGRPREYAELLTDLPAEVRAALPRAFDLVGDIVLVRLPPPVAPWADRVGAALLEFVPGARVVGWDRGVHGPERRRSVHRIAGSGGWTTRHRENGIALDVDVERAYFSPRLAGEHRRVASLVRPGERFLDLACGVGPFALLAARPGRAAAVVGVDHNSAAIALAKGNAERLGLGGRVEFVEADLQAFVAAGARFDRVVFNLPLEGIKYLTSVIGAVERGGTLLYYEMTDRSREATRSTELAALVGAEGAFRVDPPRVVHPYAPSIDLVAYTLRREGP